MRVATAALDTAAGAVLANNAFVPSGAEIFPVTAVPKIVDASGRRLAPTCIEDIEVVLGGLITKLKVWVVPMLPVPLLLVTPFLNKYVQSIFLREVMVWVHDLETDEKWSLALISPPKKATRA
jgi:hypothetical protein